MLRRVIAAALLVYVCGVASAQLLGGVGSLMGPVSGNAGGGVPANAIATEADIAIVTEAGEFIVTED